MSPRTPEEILEWATEPDIELEFERVLSMTPAEIRASLASRGHDLAALEAEARALFGLPNKTP